MKRFLKFRYGQGGFTLIELLIVVAILGILAAVIIPNAAAFMTTGTLNAANTEAENVKVAAMAYYAEHGKWGGVNKIADAATPDYEDYLSGTPKASYHFETTGTTAGCIDGVGNPGEEAAKDGTKSSGWSGIEWDISKAICQQNWKKS